MPPGENYFFRMTPQVSYLSKKRTLIDPFLRETSLYGENQSRTVIQNNHSNVSIKGIDGQWRKNLLRSAGNHAVITSNTALKTLESELSNVESTTKIGRFLDDNVDIKPSEIKVPNPEISEILENLNFCINNIQFSKANQRKWTGSFGEWKRSWSFSGIFQLIPDELWSYELFNSDIKCP